MKGKQISGYYSGLARRQFRDFRDKWIKSGFEYGFSIRQIAKAVYCSPATVAGYIKRCGRPEPCDIDKANYENFRELFNRALTNDGENPEYRKVMRDGIQEGLDILPCSWGGLERNSGWYRDNPDAI